jgi:hypothetical protein
MMNQCVVNAAAVAAVAVLLVLVDAWAAAVAFEAIVVTVAMVIWKFLPCEAFDRIVRKMFYFSSIVSFEWIRTTMDSIGEYSVME